MHSFSSRRKARRIGGGDDDGNQDQEDNNEPVVKRPQIGSKPKHRSKLRLSFGPGEASTTDDDASNTAEVFTRKKLNLGRQALERSALQRSYSPSGSAEHLPIRAGQGDDRPSYSRDYLDELRNSTPSTPKDLRSLSTSDDDGDTIGDAAVQAKFGTEIVLPPKSAIPSAAEIKEKKERRARLAKEQDFIALDDDGEREISLLPRKNKPETRLVRDDEDFGEGFDEFVEDGRISLGKKAEKEQRRRQRAEMHELIEEAEGSSSEDNSDAERHRAYEAAQTKAGMDGMNREREEQRGLSRPRTPPKITPLPKLSTCIERLKSKRAELQQNRTLLVKRMEELQQEKTEIATREGEIQRLLKEAGENYEKLKADAGTKGTNGAFLGVLQPDGLDRVDRGLENFGGSNQALQTE